MHLVRLTLLPVALCGVFACLPDPNEILEDALPGTPATPDGPSIRVTVEGATQFLEWEDVRLRETEGLSTLAFDARNNDATVNGVVSDDTPLAAGDYPIGPWGNDQQATAVGVGGIFGTLIDAWAIGETVGPGEFVIDALDRDAGLLSLHFSGDFANGDGQTVFVEGEAVDAPVIAETY